MPQVKKTKSRAKRRGNNEGSIYPYKNGTWCGQVTTGYKTDGKPIRKTVYAKTRNEVAAEIAKLTASVFANGYTTVSARKDMNFEELCKEWFSRSTKAAYIISRISGLFSKIKSNACLCLK